MLKVALLGCGGISGAHVPAWQATEGTELVAVCDIRPEMAERWKGPAHYTDFDKMLECEEIDILDICLPTYLHTEYSLRAMERKINVLCEKPLSLKARDVSLLYSTARRCGVKFMAAQVVRFWNEYEYVRQAYESGAYGALLSGSMTRLGSYPAWSWDGWMMDEERSGLVPYDLHIHDLDWLVYAFGIPEKKTCFRSKRPEQDYINAVYEYGGFFITTEASWYASPYPFTMKFRFQFENAVAAFEDNKLKIYERGGRIIDLSDDTQAVSAGINLPKTGAYGNEIAYFAECVRNKTEPDRVKPEQLEAVIRILNEIRSMGN